MGPSSFDYFRLVQGSRGSMGIVTWASIKCELLPKESEAMAFAGDDVGPLLELVYQTSHAKWGEEIILLDKVMADSVLGWTDAPAWTLLVNVTGWDYRPEERVAYQSRGIKEMARSLGLASSRSGPLSARKAMMSASAPREFDWRDGKGTHRSLYFLTTLDRTPDFAAALDEGCAELIFDRSSAGMYVQPQLGGRVAHVEMTLFLDAGEEPRGDELVMSLARKVKDLGAYFSRPAGPWAGLAYEGHPLLRSTLQRTKKLFDPTGVLNPGALTIEEVA
jgi:FAD/FMN-containing dehydrogenase